MVPNTGQNRQMGCLGSLPRDEAEGDEYQPVEEQTASVLLQYGRMMWAMCVDWQQLHIAAVSPGACFVCHWYFLSWSIYRGGTINQGQLYFCSNKDKCKEFG